MSDWKRMFELKQDDWMDACKEIDALKAEVEALTKIADAAFEFIRTRDHDAMVILKLYADKRQALLAAKDEG